MEALLNEITVAHVLINSSHGHIGPIAAGQSFVTLTKKTRQESWVHVCYVNMRFSNVLNVCLHWNPSSLPHLRASRPVQLLQRPMHQCDVALRLGWGKKKKAFLEATQHRISSLFLTERLGSCVSRWRLRGRQRRSGLQPVLRQHPVPVHQRALYPGPLGLWWRQRLRRLQWRERDLQRWIST